MLLRLQRGCHWCHCKQKILENTVFTGWNSDFLAINSFPRQLDAALMQRLLIWRNILHVDKSIIGPSPPPLEPILRRFACESMTNSANTRILYRLEQLIVAVVMIVVLSAVSNAQFTESFDGKIASFHRHQSDSSVDLSSWKQSRDCLLYTSPSPRDRQKSRMPSSA